MEIADVRHRLRDNLAVQIQDDTQDAVGRRMRRTHVQRQLLAEQFASLLRFAEIGHGSRQVVGMFNYRRHVRLLLRFLVELGNIPPKEDSQRSHVYSFLSGQKCKRADTPLPMRLGWALAESP